jgi:DNA (cytosine-5)-methyltransferase 1
MRLLDLFCGAGGAAVGYHRAGFTDITGIDNRPMPRYPFNFIQADALEYLAEHGHEYDVIHASPPCQKYTKSAKQWRANGKEYPDLVDKTRRLLQATGKPYVIENVKEAPLVDPVMLNGAMFGLLVHRDRYFESGIPLSFVLMPQNQRPVKMGRPVNEGDVIQPVGHFSGVPYAREQMGIDWMTQGELAQAIPPAYTEYIGRQLLAVTSLRSSASLERLP